MTHYVHDVALILTGGIYLDVSAYLDEATTNSWTGLAEQISFGQDIERFNEAIKNVDVLIDETYHSDPLTYNGKHIQLPEILSGMPERGVWKGWLLNGLLFVLLPQQYIQVCPQ